MHVCMCQVNEYIYTSCCMDYVEKVPVYTQSVILISCRAVDVSVLKKW